MPRELLSAARKQADDCAPPVRAAALLHIARVLAVFDRDEAMRTLDRGLAITDGVGEADREDIAESALLVAGAVDPARALPLLEKPVAPPMRSPHRAFRLLEVMLEHGHVAEAAAYLKRPPSGAEYPFHIVFNVMREYHDDAPRLEILRGAIAAWREKPSHDFLQLLSTFWATLPAEEAGALLREVVAWIIREPDHSISARIGGLNSVEFTSAQEYNLFQILNVLRRLEPGLADSLIQSRGQLAKAAAVFPLGMESALPEPPPRQPGQCGGFGVAGGAEADLPLMLAMAKARQRGDFDLLFEHALRLYAEDIAPMTRNLAARESWPSTQVFREALFHAGKAKGREAAAYSTESRTATSVCSPRSS